jgi:hypothetical protein
MRKDTTSGRRPSWRRSSAATYRLVNDLRVRMSRAPSARERVQV